MKEPSIETQLARVQVYRTAQLEGQLAFSEYNYAQLRLRTCQADQRAAELGSQAFTFVGGGVPHKAVGDISDREREIGLAFVQYVMVGRVD